jgi:uncharacterized Zn-finger protein
MQEGSGAKEASMAGQPGGFGGGFGGGPGGPGAPGRTAQEQREDLLQHITEDAEEEARKDGTAQGTSKHFDEFECPTCDAYNPHTDFGDGDEVTCAYCGLTFLAEVSEEARLKLREA